MIADRWQSRHSFRAGPASPSRPCATCGRAPRRRRSTHLGDRQVVALPTGLSRAEMSRIGGVPARLGCAATRRCSTCRARVGVRTARLLPPASTGAKVRDRVGSPRACGSACSSPAAGALPRDATAAEQARVPVDAYRRQPHRTRERLRRDPVLRHPRLLPRSRKAKLPYDVVFLLNRYFACDLSSHRGLLVAARQFSRRRDGDLPASTSYVDRACRQVARCGAAHDAGARLSH